MSGKRVADRVGRRSLDEFVRIACSTDPAEPVRRPRRLALAPRAAIGLGMALVVVALALALRTVLMAPPSTPQADSRAPAPETTPATATAPGPEAPESTAVSTGMAGELVVHVAGAVSSPGVVVLPAGARVVDAIDAAGGALPDADTDQLNLARTLSDGEQVRVPHVGEDASAWNTGGGIGEQAGSDSGATGSEGSGTTVGGRVNINTADAAELEALPGIGPALAQRIVDYRNEHGPFASVDELTSVSGIGAAKLEALRDRAAV
ncbi:MULTISPECIES: ComEA family DNA-binding protein [unclassified Actinomyces]|uniref:ComEA family DNA-binding protein n=1 Tax=unclassified Actinomyces TaxID=2609248 RepID=UPI0019392B72|nr:MULTISPECIES: ComEA family DNA-binding protein [unclassified Actinomyces]